jgi:enoyl-CoA hydratase/carnithine racemase
MREASNDLPRSKDGTIDIAIEGHIGWLTFNNPLRHNALNQAMWQDLPDKINALEQDNNVRTIVLRGSGERAFCAGADISEFDKVRKDAATARQYEAENVAAFSAIRQCRKPVIAMIHGHCMGGGFGIAAACDLRLASDEASFAVPAARLGLAYPVSALADIVNAVGEQAAKEILLTARKFTAYEIHDRRFLTKLCSKDLLAQEVNKIATMIAANAPATLEATKQTIHGLHSGDMNEANSCAAATFESRDYKEGRAAFREKRKPNFTGE